MNVLAKAQQKVFEPGLSDEIRSERELAFFELYNKVRDKDEKSILGKLSLKTRKRLHKLILCLFKMKNRFSGFSCKVIKDERTETERPVIFALTHVGKYDIEVSAVGIREHFYLLTGEYEHLQGTLYGTFLLINGVIYFCETVKRDRKAVKEKMIEHLRNGGNLMYFPEGTWNLTPNLPVLPCFWGIVEIAQKSNAIIVPVAVEQYGKCFKVNIGENFDMMQFGIDANERRKAITALRDELATLKWEIWESEELQKRSEIKGDEWSEYVKKRLEEWPYFTEEYIEGMICRAEN